MAAVTEVLGTSNWTVGVPSDHASQLVSSGLPLHTFSLQSALEITA